jgi:hypothetical protein
MPGPTSTRTTDHLQIAAQLYSWLYMTSSLEASFQIAELSAHVRMHQAVAFTPDT